MGTYPTGVQYRGLNRAGAEYGDDWSGWSGQEYFTFPTTAELAAELTFYAGKGFNVLRLPISWERLQHDLYGDLDEDYRNQVEAFVEQANNGWLDGHPRSAQLQPVRNRGLRRKRPAG